MILYFPGTSLDIVHLKFLKFRQRHEKHHRTLFNLSESSDPAERSHITLSTRKVIHQTAETETAVQTDQDVARVQV